MVGVWGVEGVVGCIPKVAVHVNLFICHLCCYSHRWQNMICVEQFAAAAQVAQRGLEGRRDGGVGRGGVLAALWFIG